MIIKPHQKEHFHLLGGKASSLASLANAGTYCVPEWFAVTDSKSSEEILKQAEAVGSTYFAVRSSAHGEDGAEHSFAGQYDSFLYVKQNDLLEKIDQVFHSNQSAHLDSYRYSKETTEAQQVTAIVQKMLTPTASGVAFSADPVTGDRDKVIISSLWGTGSALVSGEENADTWTIEDDKVIEKIIAQKTHQHVLPKGGEASKEGVQRVNVEEDLVNEPSLTEEQIKEICDLSKQCEVHFGCPQDIEWAINSTDGKLYLLQSRPITTLVNLPKATLPLTVWDNSNIAESYSGITSPLTFTFAERIYEHVYREFCVLLSVPKGRIKKHDAVFSKMLGHIHGHVYYNLNSWYHVLAMLPGFSINRNFMEQMMGVKVPMPDKVIEEIVAQTHTNKIYDAYSLLKTMLGLVRNQLGLEKSIKNFYKRLNTALDAPSTPLHEMNKDELIMHYNDLEAQLLRRWDAPLVNDFFAMIYYGVLKSLCEKWLGDASLQNSLLLDSGDIVSAEPPRRIAKMASIVREHSNLKEQLNKDNSIEKKLTSISSHPELKKSFDSYLEKFGDRCLEELKLESPSVRDNPGSLIDSIIAMANRDPKKPANDDESLPLEKSSPLEEAMEQLSGLKRKIFGWVLKNARNRVRDRENLRFERTRLFGRVRDIMVHLGKILATDNLLENPRDVFYLELSEVLDKEKKDYKSLVNERREEEKAYTNQLAPPDRFHTVAPISKYEEFHSELPYSAPDGDNLTGIGACPGVVRGRARVVHNPHEASINEGEILVAQQTDPGWVVLFPAAAGLLVERGSLLSHSAIVARELHLPCIVSVPHVTRILKTGDMIEMDGKSGTITIISNED